ncbi:MAG: two-component system, regulatory protein [Bdellovibrio sp. ArHS]|uniref:response regulator transcription factor n=1 Tax=Bdellovibrio sp. ArHS TaxID=1569284 RepID=UPI0005828502|nr:response regulator [Bdellovibrio sp. ArHS]KHD89099.1 MAG: two-component system, regulatory protein [Bdellovibrio sp. ArHS]
MDIKGKKLLLIEDDRNLREVLTEELQDRGMTVTSFAHTPSLEEIHEAEWALLDLRVGSENGLEFLKGLKEKFPQAKVIMMSGFGSVASAVKAMQLGAHSFISKPVTPDMIIKAFTDQNIGEEVPEQEISLARMEREYIDYVLQSSDGNITQAAKKLGLHRQSLQRKLRKNIPNK